MEKVILILVDGVTRDQAFTSMGFLQAMAEGHGIQADVQAQLPSWSRPNYETILTGLKPIDSGITSNKVNKLSVNESIFSATRAKGLTTAAAAFSWIAELYIKNVLPYDPSLHRRIDDESADIQHGIFYYEDTVQHGYPDSALFADTESLRVAYNPDFLFSHSMMTDANGHYYGSESREYHNSCVVADELLGLYIPRWLEAGYNIVVTSDHGMTSDGQHGGSSDIETNVFFYGIGSAFKKENIGKLQSWISEDSGKLVIKQTDIKNIIDNILTK